MNETVQFAEKHLLTPAGLDVGRAQDILMGAAGGLDWADFFLQQRISENWGIENGAVKTGSFSESAGVGMRALRGETTAFVSSDIISEAALGQIKDAAHAARTYGGTITMDAAPSPQEAPARFGRNNPAATDSAPKIALLERIDKMARAADPRVENVIASIGSGFSVNLVLRADGSAAADVRPMVQLSVQVILGGSRRESGSSAGGARAGLDHFDDQEVHRIVSEAVSEAAEKADASPAPAGVMPVVLGPGWAGIILHEAVGHGLEGDANRKGQSAFAGRIGEKVAADGVTVVDAGNIDGRRGSLSCDDEGTPTGETVLIENGVLRGYMQDVANARLMRAAPTGNGRRESYAHPPMPRMTNTFMRGGSMDPGEIIASVKRGLYAESFNGGSVDITSGNFVFAASRARLIEDGKLGAVVKGATLVGNGPEIMPLVSMVGSDFSLDHGVGMCGKNGQWVPVGVGQPTIKVDALNVGGEGGQ